MSKSQIICVSMIFILFISSFGSTVGVYPVREAEDMNKETINSVFPGYSSRIHDMINHSKNSNLYNYTYTLQNFTTRKTGTSGYKQAGDWIYDKFTSFGLDTRMQNFTYDGDTVSNIIGVLHGSHPKKKENTYIISGHYDSISSTTGVAPGADDDGSGIALTIEAARIMSKYSFNKTIRFCAWGAEEQGLIGSKKYVNNINTTSEKVDGMFQFDMIGYSDHGLNLTMHANPQSRWMLDYYSDVDSNYDIPLNLTLNYDSKEDRSDHASFWDGGYNASLAIESVFSPYYHTTDDTVDEMTIPQVTNTTKLAMGTVAHLAELSPIQVDLLSLEKNEDITAGSDHKIKWNMSDTRYAKEDLVVDLYYSLNDGESWKVIETNHTGFSSPALYQWTVPENSTRSARVKLEVTNPDGLTIISRSPSFNIPLQMDRNHSWGGRCRGWHLTSTIYFPI